MNESSRTNVPSTMSGVPVVDIAPFFQPGPEGRTDVARQVRDACEGIGFFVVTGHGVPLEVTEGLYAQAGDFFGLPLEEKLKVAKPQGTDPRGFAPQGTKTVGKDRDATLKPSLHESFAIGPLDIGGDDYYHCIAAGTHFRPNLWPEQPSSLKPLMTSYYRHMERLAQGILAIFAEALEVPPAYFLSKVQRHTSVLRLIHYPGLLSRPAPGEERSAAHTDTTAITILRIDDAPGGLEVKTREGQWVPVTRAPDSFVINIGDVMMRWTNDRFVSTMHRVTNPPVVSDGGSTRRISIPYFCLPDYDAVIECVPGCEGDGAKYPSITSGELLSKRYRTTYSLDDAAPPRGVPA